MTNFGSGIWLYSRRTRLAILKLTVPATIIRSAWRGVARNAPAPKRSRSNRLAPVAIISMAQHARPNVMGHMLDSRAQLIACSSVVAMTLSSRNVPSSQPMNVTSKTRIAYFVRGSLEFFSCADECGGFLDRRRPCCGALRRGASDPIQVAALPQVGEPDQQHPEK